VIVPVVCTSYRLDFASGAWSQVGALERAVFQEITDQLRNVAAEVPRLAGALPDTLPSPVNRARLECGEYSALYEIDHQNCTVTVVELVHTGSSTHTT
jgi:hypothetical protein